MYLKLDFMCSSLCSDCVLASTLQCSDCCVDVNSLCACVYTVSTELIPRLCASDLCISLVFVVLTSACLYFQFAISACLCASCLCPVAVFCIDIDMSGSFVLHV